MMFAELLCSHKTTRIKKTVYNKVIQRIVDGTFKKKVVYISATNSN